MFLLAPLGASEKGYWTTLEVKAYNPTNTDSLSDGLTRYGTNAYQEGCAGDRVYYPQGTKIYVSWRQLGKIKGKWFTVDDTHSKTVGKKNRLYLRFLTDFKVDQWNDGPYRVYVVLPRE